MIPFADPRRVMTSREGILSLFEAVAGSRFTVYYMRVGWYCLYPRMTLTSCALCPTLLHHLFSGFAYLIPCLSPHAALANHRTGRYELEG